MTNLKDSACTACRVDAQRVTEIEVAELMTHIPEWHIQMVDEESRLCDVTNLKTSKRRWSLPTT